MEETNMKRCLALFTVLLLALPMACPAEKAGGQVFETQYFTMQLPEDWTIDTRELEKEEDMEMLGYLFGPEDADWVLESAIMYYKDLKDIALWNSDEEEMQDYIDAVLEDFKDEEPEYLKTVMAGQIPFVLIRAVDDDGPYYYADTMTNGYAIVFYAYIARNDLDRTLEPTEEQMQQLEEILLTFAPVT